MSFGENSSVTFPQIQRYPIPHWNRSGQALRTRRQAFRLRRPGHLHTRAVRPGGDCGLRVGLRPLSPVLQRVHVAAGVPPGPGRAGGGHRDAGDGRRASGPAAEGRGTAAAGAARHFQQAPTRTPAVRQQKCQKKGNKSIIPNTFFHHRFLS